MLQIPDSQPNTHRYSHRAMATVFEIAVIHPDQIYAGQAAFAAFQEAGRLETELSRFIDSSDISRLNHCPAMEPIVIGLDAWNCLERCRIISQETNYAFDANVGFFMDCYINPDKTKRSPAEDEIRYAAEHSGFSLVEFLQDFQKEFPFPLPPTAIRLRNSPVQLDLGAIGKGFAVDKMIEILQEWDIENALVHGGGSSVYALGSMDGDGWPLYCSDPENAAHIFHRFNLRDASISASGLRKGEHIIDPRSGQPVHHHRAAWVIGKDAVRTDALSTAFMVMQPDDIADYCGRFSEIQAWVLLQDQQEAIFFGNHP